MIRKHRPPHIHPDDSFLFLTGRIYGGFSYLALGKTKEYLLEKLCSILEKYKITLKAWVVLDNHYHLLIKTKEGELVVSFIRELHGATANFIRKNLPPLITEFGQRLTKEQTPWDKRQTKKLALEEQQLRRELKFAKTEKDKTKVLAQFIARYRKRFNSAVYRGLKSAITKGRLVNPAVLVSLTARNAPIWYQYCDHVIRNERDYFCHLNYIHQNPIKHGYLKKMNSYEFSSIHKFIREKGGEWIIDCFRKYPIIDFEPEGIVD